ncbi:hypothetical protein [Paenibacillus sp. EPM92]|uniref:hypothetical protein n=1 Tax=Paenibacillus sp. EPM92 TaxID=1561195 RepID=UPI0019164B1D|nr:hypothetical protein [Paenibacillus sp. EPM92]
MLERSVSRHSRIGIWAVVVTQLPILLFGPIAYLLSPPNVPLLVFGIPAMWFWAFLFSILAFIGITIAVYLDSRTEQKLEDNPGVKS